MSSASQMLFGSVQGKEFSGSGLVWTPDLLFSDGTAGLWFDITDTSTVLNSLGEEASVLANIYEIVNKAPTGDNLTRARSTEAVLKEDSNSVRYLDFLGRNAIYIADTNHVNSNYVMFQMSAMKIRDANTSSVVFNGLRYSSQDAGTAQYLLNSAQNTNITANARNSSSGYVSAGTLPIVDPYPHDFIGGFAIDGNADTVTLYKDSQSSSGTGATYSPPPSDTLVYMLGGRDTADISGGASLYCDDGLYETVVMSGRLPTTDEFNNLVQYLGRHFL